MSTFFMLKTSYEGKNQIYVPLDEKLVKLIWNVFYFLPLSVSPCPIAIASMYWDAEFTLFRQTNKLWLLGYYGQVEEGEKFFFFGGLEIRLASAEKV